MKKILESRRRDFFRRRRDFDGSGSPLPPARIIAASYTGAIIGSDDGGSTWTAKTVSTSIHIFGISHFAGVWIARGAGAVFSTDDGENWNLSSLPAGAATAGGGLACSSTLAVAARDASRDIYTSIDGINWTLHASVLPNSFGSAFGNSIVSLSFDPTIGLFLITGNDATFGTLIGATSPDGVNWTVRAGLASGFSSPGGIPTTFPSNGTFLAGHTGFGNGSGFKTSIDGINWSVEAVNPFTNPSYALGCYNGFVWAAGNSSIQDNPPGNANVFVSSSGGAWTVKTPPAGTYFAVGNSGRKLIALGRSVIATSTDDGDTWTASAAPVGDWYAAAS
jgi:hypothetical protein